MRSKSFGERIADVLIEEGLLLPNQLEEAIGIQKAEGGRLLKVLTDRQFVTEQDMVFSMGRCLNTPPVNLARLRVPEEVMSLVPREMAKANRLVAIARLDGKLFVAMADPTNVLAVDDLKRRVQLEIVPMIATERAVADALSGVHGAGNHDPGDEKGRRGSRAIGRGSRSSIDHAIISIFNQAPIMSRLASTRISGTLPSCSPPKSISSNPRFGFGRRLIRR
jgi:hypothetical protein